MAGFSTAAQRRTVTTGATIDLRETWTGQGSGSIRISGTCSPRLVLGPSLEVAVIRAVATVSTSNPAKRSAGTAIIRTAVSGLPVANIGGVNLYDEGVFVRRVNGLDFTGEAVEVTATAQTGGIAVSGTGGGGFIDYNDTSTAGGLALTADTWTTLPNNGAGTFSNSTYSPINVTDLLDTATGFFDFTELELGAVAFIRNDFTVTPSVNNATLRIRYQLGTGGGLYYLEKTAPTLTRGAGIGYRFSMEVDKIYMGDLNTRDNPVVLQINLSVAGTVVNAGSVISVLRFQP